MNGRRLNKWAQCERGGMDVEDFVQYGTVKRDECILQ
jgi:hypothetical protein